MSTGRGYGSCCLAGKVQRRTGHASQTLLFPRTGSVASVAEGATRLRSRGKMTPFAFTCDAFARRQLRTLHCVHPRSVLLPGSTKTATASFRARYDGVVARISETDTGPSVCGC